MYYKLDYNYTFVVVNKGKLGTSFLNWKRPFHDLQADLS